MKKVTLKGNYCFLPQGVCAILITCPKKGCPMEDKNQRPDRTNLSQDYYKVLVEESFDGIFIQKGPKIWLANGRLHEMLGYKPNELIGLDHWMVYTPEYQSLTRERAKARMRGEDVTPRYRVKLQRKDGSWLWGEINAKAVMVEGEPGVLVWIRDIHQQVLMQDALEQSELRFRSAFEHAGIGIAIVSPDGRFIEANGFFASFLGYKREDLIGMRIEAVTHKKDWQRDVEVHRSLLSGLYQNIVVDKRYVKPSGMVVWGRVSSSLLKDKNGNPLYVISHVQDITKEKEAIEKLREKETFISGILAVMPDPMVVYDTNMNVLYINPAFTKTFGWDKSEFQNDPGVFLPSSDLYLTDSQAIKSIIYQGQPYVETKRATKHGKEIDVVLTASLLKQDHLKGYVVIYRDITEFNTIKQRVESIQRLESLAYLAGGVAHDFNNLLTGILGRTSILKLKKDLPEEYKSQILEMEKCALEASNLTKQLLMYARGEKPSLQSLDLNSLAQDVIQMFGRTKKDLTIFKLLEDDLPYVVADKSQLEQVILNILVNASDAMPAGGKIYVETSKVFLDQRYVEPYGVEPGQYVRIAITDTGSGIPPEIQKRIFEPFFSTKELGKGTGLGLATVYRIVRSHSGIINCYSEVGRGTTFTIYLPTVTQGVLESKEKSKYEEELPQGNERILLVDDEEVVLEVGRDMLEYLGYGVDVTNSGRKGLEAISGGVKYDLVILDIVMPETGGMEVFRELRRLNPNQKVLFASGYSLNGEMNEILNEKHVGFIQKPFNLHELARVVREILDK